MAHVVEDAMELFQPLASRLHRPNHVKVRSTTHRRGSRTKPAAVSERLTISMVRGGLVCLRRDRQRLSESTARLMLPSWPAGDQNRFDPASLRQGRECGLFALRTLRYRPIDGLASLTVPSVRR